MTNNNSNNMLTVDFSTTQSTQSTGYYSDDELFYEWEDYLCILLKSGNYITIDSNNIVALKSQDSIFGIKLEKRFFKLRVGVRAGTMWMKTLDYDVEDYQRILIDSDIIYRLEKTIEPNPTYISEMKAELRELQINRIV
jgi:hypothetical protein